MSRTDVQCKFWIMSRSVHHVITDVIPRTVPPTCVIDHEGRNAESESSDSEEILPTRQRCRRTGKQFRREFKSKRLFRYRYASGRPTRGRTGSLAH